MLGDLVTASSAGASLTTIAAFFFLDRTGWPLRRTAFVSMACFGIANFITPMLFEHDLLLILVFFIAGCASGLIWASCATAITAIGNTPRLVSLFYGSPYLTGMVIQPLMPGLYASFGVARVFELIGISCFLSFLIMSWFPDRSRGASPAGNKDSLNNGQWGIFWLLMLPIVASLLLQYTANSGLWVFFDRIGLNSGHSPQLSANIVSLGVGMALVGTALAVVLTPHLPPLQSIVVINIVAAIATLGLLGSENYLVFALSIFVFNASITLITPFYFLVLGRLSISAGKAVLLFNIVMMAGYTLGPLVMGRLASHGDFTLPVYVTSAMFVTSAIFILIKFKKRENP
jgi:hypothetical protein